MIGSRFESARPQFHFTWQISGIVFAIALAFLVPWSANVVHAVVSKGAVSSASFPAALIVGMHLIATLIIMTPVIRQDAAGIPNAIGNKVALGIALCCTILIAILANLVILNDPSSTGAIAYFFLPFGLVGAFAIAYVAVSYFRRLFYR